MNLNYYAPRSCYEAATNESWRNINARAKPLADYRDYPAYVLLGKPGSGKTTAFNEEAKQPSCEYVTARDFITFDVNQGWNDKTIFIDGLDEVRAGKTDTLTPFDNIRKKLAQLGRPRFRLSCREADWYGAGDRKELEKVSPDQNIRELFLAELREEDIKEILSKNHPEKIMDVSSFLKQVKLRGFTDLTKNPQVLDMLVTAVAGSGDWPETKSGTFKLACEKLLLAEWNRTHNDANRRQAAGTEQLMRAAGLLCALLLLSRKQGFALSRSDADEDYPFIEDMDIDQTGLLTFAAKTKLFTTHNGRAEYSHRIFAEYLSAYYLSGKILNKGLPIGRILALMTGDDGGVVTELRGVYAWLTALYHQKRSMLMQRDPLGVVLYGDVSLFSKEERLILLDALHTRADETEELEINYWDEQSFGPFCQADMEQEFRAILASTERGTAQQCLLAYVLASMIHGEKLAGLSDSLVGLLRDPDWWPRNRKDALKVLIRFDDEQVLRGILTDINSHVITDPDDHLLATLINSLYPGRITPAEIFNYLHSLKNPNHVGLYENFWCHTLAEQSDDEQIAQLLDALVEKQGVLGYMFNKDFYRTMLSELLARGIELFGDTTGIERLSGWLGLGLDKHDSIALSNDKQISRIRAWFQQYPETQKRLIEYHLDKCNNEENFNRCMYKMTERLFGADLPEDYGRWCLDKAKSADNETIAKYLFMESARVLFTRKGNSGMSLELVEAETAKDTRLKSYWDEARVAEIDPGYSKSNLERIKRREREKQEKQAFVQSIKNNLTSIEAGTASPGIFDQLSGAYYGRFTEARGDTLLERLNDFFGHDSDLVHSVLKGLRRFLDREDIPEVTEIFQLNKDGFYSTYSYPYRAAMDELVKDGDQQILQIGEDKIEKALAFQFADGSDKETVWHEVLLQERPDLVARIYIKYGTMALRAGELHMTSTYPLTHGEVAHHATLPLLKSAPTRGVTKQIMLLDCLLKAAIQHADQNQLRKLIEKKLSLKSMNTAQRVRWLAAGFILDPVQSADRLIEFVLGNESRISHLSWFLLPIDNQWSPLDDLPPSALARLIKLLGPYCMPYRSMDSDNKNFLAIDTLRLTSNLINLLALSKKTDEATKELETLLELDNLTKWHSELRRTLRVQRINKREAMFEHPSLEQVCHTLKNGLPANVADLASTTCERIRELANRIKNSNTNDYQQYWVRDKNRLTHGRRHEEDCRDAFLSDLRPLLSSMNIHAEPEGRYAADKRADIKVSYGDYHVPIEIKCNDNRELWHGIRKQLIEKYAIDPDAGGYGIYLIFWFGHAKTTPYSGTKPKTPAELEERLYRLLANNEERKKISVCVVDCTGPPYLTATHYQPSFDNDAHCISAKASSTSDDSSA